MVGLSDHSIGSEAGFLATALGAVAIEKHFIADRSIGGVDAEFSATPQEFLQLRKRVDLAKEMIGEPDSERPDSEKQGKTFRKSVYYITNKNKGEILSKNDGESYAQETGCTQSFFTCLKV